jgi:6-hydroxytryprostatin B O-methyltransferase
LQVGGSAGHDDIELAQHYPSVKFIIQDRAEVVASFEASLPSDLNSRISFQTHDFMTPQPIKGADVYFLKHILHDWPDVVSVKILQMKVPAMTPFENRKGSRLLIMDSMIPEMGEVPLTVMQLNTEMDLQMMAALSAKERTRADWEALLRAADQRLRISNVRQPIGSADAVIEVVLDPHL